VWQRHPRKNLNHARRIQGRNWPIPRQPQQELDRRLAVLDLDVVGYLASFAPSSSRLEVFIPRPDQRSTGIGADCGICYDIPHIAERVCETLEE
jgi:hypothetical protein